MTEKERLYIELYRTEYLTLKQACEIWRKPGYSTLSKQLPKIGYLKAVEAGIIPKFRKVGTTYLFKIADILDFLQGIGD
jgi:hypothetical protein